MKKNLLTLALCTLSIIAIKAQNISQDFVYFDSDSHVLTQSDMNDLDNLYSQLQDHSDFELSIIGHTDQDGSDDYNDALAQKRAEEVHNYLVSKGATADQVNINWQGEKQLADTNNTGSAKQKNRRVEVQSTVYDYENADDIIISAHTVETQHYSVDLSEEQTIDCNAGSTIIVPADAFVHADGTPVDASNITLDIREAFTYSDFIAEGLYTHSKGEILETGGMMYINATANGKDLKLQEGKSLEIIYPLQNVESDMQLFYADEDEEGNLDWTPTEQAIGTTDIKLEDYASNIDLSRLFNYDFGDMTKPKLYFDRMPAKPSVRKLPHPPAEPVRGYPSQYKKYREKYKNYELALEEYHIEKPKEEQALEEWHAEVENRFQKIWAYKKSFKEFHAKVQAISGLRKINKLKGKRSTAEIINMIYANFNQGLTLEINDRKLISKALHNYTNQILVERKMYQQTTNYKQYKLQNLIGGTIKKLINDAMTEATELKFAATGEVGGKELSSYVTNINQLGWINCDRFPNYPMRYDLFVKMDDQSTNYYMIFYDIKSIIRPKKEDGYFVFKDIPGMNVKVLGIKLVDKKPYIAIKDHKISKNNIINIDFQPGTLAQIKKELSLFEG